MLVRPATPLDYLAVAKLFPELMTPDVFPSLERWTAEFLPYTDVLEERDEVVGYLHTQVLGDLGYVRQLVIDPRMRRKGYARALMVHARERFATLGRHTWCLNVKPDNAAAVSLYESLGMRVAYPSNAMDLLWEKVAPTSSRTEIRTFEAEDDAVLERAFSIPRGLIASNRVKPDRVYLKAILPDAGHGENVVGVAVFDRAFPGVYPLSSTEPSFALDLLAAARPYARPSDTFVRILCEDARLSDALLGIGATVTLKLLHYRGTV